MISLGVLSPEKKYFSNKKNYLKNYSIGDYTYGTPTVLMPSDGAVLEIGKFCSIANGVIIFLGGNHRTDWISTYPFNSFPREFPEAVGIKGHPSSKGSVIIGNDVWIGTNVMILSGVTISDGAVIAAGAVITKNIGPYEIWAGNPAKCIRKRFSDEEIAGLLKIKWWDWPIEKVRNHTDLLCNNNIDYLISSFMSE